MKDPAFRRDRFRMLLHLSAAVVIALGVSPSSALADELYSIVNLGSLGSGAASPAAINSSGSVVGFTTNYAGYQVPVTFNGQANTLGGTGMAAGINDSGVVVGTGYGANSSPFVTEWSNGQTQSLGISGYGMGINNSGEVVGGMLVNSQMHAYLWDNGTLIDVGALLGSSWSSAYAVNASGEVVGNSMNSGTTTAFIYNGTTVTTLGTLGGSQTHGMAINNSGDVAGSSTLPNGYSHAFLENSQGMTDLGTLGGTQSYAYGINDLDEVVGYSLLSNNVSDAFAYMGGVLIDLNDLLVSGSGWTINAAYGVNDAGDIVAEGSYDDQLYAVELLPQATSLALQAPVDPLAVPEPQALFLSGAGLITLATLFRRCKRTHSTAYACNDNQLRSCLNRSFYETPEPYHHAGERSGAGAGISQIHRLHR